MELAECSTFDALKVYGCEEGGIRKAGKHCRICVGNYKANKSNSHTVESLPVTCLQPRHLQPITTQLPSILFKLFSSECRDVLPDAIRITGQSKVLMV